MLRTLTVFLLFLAFGPISFPATQVTPNVLFIIADDLGWLDAGFNGSPDILTPHLDRLAEEGVIFDQHYVTPSCSPTRLALLTGRFPSRFGMFIPTNHKVLEYGTVTLASALQSRGYFTAITGKWHLGSMPEWGPLQYGFSASHGSLAGGVDQYEHFYKSGPFRRTWHRNDQYVKETGHATDLFMQEAIRWIDETGDRPWYIQVSFTAPHIPLQEPREWLRVYDRKIDNPSRKLFAAAITHLDHAVGEIVSTLERNGLRDRTLIVFTSDNGGLRAWLGTDQYDGGHHPLPVIANNGKLRGWKSSVYEGGIRVPAFATWPGVLKPGKLTAPIHIVDWFPTLTKLVGFESPDGDELDGRDIWPILTREEISPPPRTFYWRERNARALRHGDWKLVEHFPTEHFPTGQTELFNLTNDPYERADLSSRMPQRLNELKRLMEEVARTDRSKTIGEE